MDEIKVYVVKYNNRKNLVMRFLPPGKKTHITRSTGTTKKREAERLAAKWEAELQKGPYAKPSMASWAHFRDKYEQEILTELAPNTEKKAIGVLNAIEEAINPTRVSDITHDNLSTYIKTMREKGRAGATIAGHITHLKSALGFAVKWKMITTLPDMPDLKRVKRSNMMKGRPITLEEHERMLEATTEIVGDKADESWQYFQRGLWASGLRLDEALHLYWYREGLQVGRLLRSEAGRS